LCQEYRAHGRSRHQHRRNGLLHDRRPLDPRPTPEGRYDQLCRAQSSAMIARGKQKNNRSRTGRGDGLSPGRSYERESKETPKLNAFCLVAPSVLLSERAIFRAGVFCRALAFSSRMSSLVHWRRLDGFFAMLSPIEAGASKKQKDRQLIRSCACSVHADRLKSSTSQMLAQDKYGAAASPNGFVRSSLSGFCAIICVIAGL
jgi:hypothetical protein